MFFFLPFGWSASGNNLKNHLESNPTLTRGLRKTTDPSCHSQGSLKWVWTSNSRYLSTTASFHFHAYGRKSTFFKQNHFTLVTSLFLWVGGHLTYLWFRVTWTHHPKKVTVWITWSGLSKLEMPFSLDAEAAQHLSIRLATEGVISFQQCHGHHDSCSVRLGCSKKIQGLKEKFMEIQGI